MADINTGALRLRSMVSQLLMPLNDIDLILCEYIQAISKMQITFKDKAQADEKAEHTWEYVSILKRLATP
jgi:hypothetical protein